MNNGFFLSYFQLTSFNLHWHKNLLNLKIEPSLRRLRVVGQSPDCSEIG
uniref:Uncharacterized protein n=1 Tax=Utricularia reniformis TaxID=192314 RepID=A0A1Y0B0M8_9LAMI|nr:hypothetical protein AEK19_MT0702 [Utricularia reniformis]ART30949.1 hypothetical protein AEK19_MT0702 [Utricularia reniformis]